MKKPLIALLFLITLLLPLQSFSQNWLTPFPNTRVVTTFDRWYFDTTVDFPLWIGDVWIGGDNGSNGTFRLNGLTVTNFGDYVLNSVFNNYTNSQNIVNSNLQSSILSLTQLIESNYLTNIVFRSTDSPTNYISTVSNYLGISYVNYCATNGAATGGSTQYIYRAVDSSTNYIAWISNSMANSIAFFDYCSTNGSGAGITQQVVFAVNSSSNYLSWVSNNTENSISYWNGCFTNGTLDTLYSNLNGNWKDITNVSFFGANSIAASNITATLISGGTVVGNALVLNGSGSVAGNLTIEGTLTVNDDLYYNTVINVSTTVYMGTTTQFINQTIYSTQVVYQTTIVATNYTIWTTNFVQTYVNINGSWDATNAAWVGTPSYRSDRSGTNAELVARGIWDFSDAEIIGFSGGATQQVVTTVNSSSNYIAWVSNSPNNDISYWNYCLTNGVSAGSITQQVVRAVASSTNYLAWISNSVENSISYWDSCFTNGGSAGLALWGESTGTATQVGTWLYAGGSPSNGIFLGNNSSISRKRPDGTTVGGPANGANSVNWGSVQGGWSGAGAIADYSTIGGGWRNYINGSSGYSLIAGGRDNQIQGGEDNVIAGGNNNNLYTPYSTGGNVIGGGQGNGSYSLIAGRYNVTGGGIGNLINNAWYSIIAGGAANYLGPSDGSTYGLYNVIAGGAGNSITNAMNVTIAGGYYNLSSGNDSFIYGGRYNRIAATNSTILQGVGVTNPTPNRAVIGNDLEVRGTTYLGTLDMQSGDINNVGDLEVEGVLTAPGVLAGWITRSMPTNRQLGTFFYPTNQTPLYAGTNVGIFITKNQAICLIPSDEFFALTRGQNAIDFSYEHGTATEGATANYSISMGNRSKASGVHSIAMGGYVTHANGYESVAIGGEQIYVNGNYSTVVGGQLHLNDGTLSATIGGYDNDIASVYYGALFGGNGNRANAWYSGSFLGAGNTLNGYKSGSFMGSGNTLNAPYSIALGGINNVIAPLATNSIILQGNDISNNTPNRAIIGNDLEVRGTITSPSLRTNEWDTAYSWGDHALAGYGTGSGNVNSATNNEYNVGTTQTFATVAFKDGSIMTTKPTSFVLWSENTGTATQAGTWLTPDGTNGLFIGKNGSMSKFRPDSSASGGDARGAHSIDFQLPSSGGYSPNVASGYASARLGGSEGSARGDHSVSVGGRGGGADGQYSFAGGGWGNASVHYLTTVVGGYYNIAHGNGTAIVGGERNGADGAGGSVGDFGIYNFFGGGIYNRAGYLQSGSYNAIAGGAYNFLRGSYGAIPGGYDNSVDDYGFSAGYRAYNTNLSSVFIWNGYTGDTNYFKPAASNTVLFKTAGFGINTNNPQASLHVSGTTLLQGQSSLIGNLDANSGDITEVNSIQSENITATGSSVLFGKDIRMGSTNILIGTNGNIFASGTITGSNGLYSTSGVLGLGTNVLIVGGVAYPTTNMFDAFASDDVLPTNGYSVVYTTNALGYAEFVGPYLQVGTNIAEIINNLNGITVTQVFLDIGLNIRTNIFINGILTQGYTE